MRERKTLELVEFKDSGDGAGEFAGRASTFGTIDSYGDTVDAGAYKDTIPDFLKRGFIGWGHNWDEPIGYVTGAEERSDGLYISGQFHSDPESQRRRQIARERIDKGLFMGLSIGYEAEAAEERTLKEPIRGKFGELTDKVRALTKIKLFEVSLVMVPAESNSGLTAIKGDGLAFADHAEQVRVALEELLKRVESGSEIRTKVGRAISAARMATIDDLIGSMESGLEKLRVLRGDTSAGSEEEPEEPVVGIEEVAAQVPEDLKEWVARYHTLQRIYGST